MFLLLEDKRKNLVKCTQNPIGLMLKEKLIVQQWLSVEQRGENWLNLNLHKKMELLLLSLGQYHFHHFQLTGMLFGWALEDGQEVLGMKAMEKSFGSIVYCTFEMLKH